MSKYAPLGRHLAAQPSPQIRLAFSEIERLLGDSLPASAHNHRAWWANERSGPHPQAHAWMGAGWRVDSVNLAAQHVTFVRGSLRDPPTTLDRLRLIVRSASAAMALVGW